MKKKTTEKQDEGTLGERGMRCAEAYLKRRGFEDVQDVSDGVGNPVLAGRDEEELVFVEVRTVIVSQAGVGGAEEYEAARERMECLAVGYIAEHPDLAEGPVRFDTIEIKALSTANPSPALLRHHFNAFSA